MINSNRGNVKLFFKNYWLKNGFDRLNNILGSKFKLVQKGRNRSGMTKLVLYANALYGHRMLLGKDSANCLT